MGQLQRSPSFPVLPNKGFWVQQILISMGFFCERPWRTLGFIRPHWPCWDWAQAQQRSHGDPQMLMHHPSGSKPVRGDGCQTQSSRKSWKVGARLGLYRLHGDLGISTALGSGKCSVCANKTREAQRQTLHSMKTSKKHKLEQGP